jgi:hypothetical protein
MGIGMLKYYEFIDSLTRWNIENDVKSTFYLYVILSKWHVSTLA